MFDFEIIDNWAATKNIKSQWSALYKQSKVGHPFTTYEWFDCWYPAFCKDGQERIILLKDENGIRAIFPGMIEKYNKGGVTFKRFSFAANGHSPRCGIIANANDHDAIDAILLAPFSQLSGKIFVTSIHAVYTSSDTHSVLMSIDPSNAFLHEEHSFESPAFEMPEGWGVYLLSRSKDFRRRLKRKIKQATKLGDVSVDILEGSDALSGAIDRLKVLDRKTWQHKNGTGLFSIGESADFYSNLMRVFSTKGNVSLCFLQVNGNDISYEIAISRNLTMFFLKYGFDPAFNKCSPGVLIQSFFGEHVSFNGFKEVDLVGEITPEKESWETKRREHVNYWLVDPKSLKGRLLISALRIKNSIKR